MMQNVPQRAQTARLMTRSQRKLSRMLTAAEVASYLRLHVMTVYRMAQLGELPSLRIGQQWRFQRDHIDGWLRKHSQRQSTVCSAGPADRGSSRMEAR